MLPYHPELPGQRDFLLIHLPPGEHARRSGDRMLDDRKITVHLNNSAALNAPQ